ncbi:hypothetical protein FJU08_20065 [Martelella alba]|uniref:Lipoprotein n=1 Tax=Martelella alba TaxID=2590451 RepID=A0A506TZK5_9HYPH|nr:hypothetical protein [Martelella alba]TPW27513.1 hypothetical protein FJU08_20065 [Martelella alba]
MQLLKMICAVLAAGLLLASCSTVPSDRDISTLLSFTTLDMDPATLSVAVEKPRWLALAGDGAEFGLVAKADGWKTRSITLGLDEVGRKDLAGNRERVLFAVKPSETVKIEQMRDWIQARAKSKIKTAYFVYINVTPDLCDLSRALQKGDRVKFDVFLRTEPSGSYTRASTTRIIPTREGPGIEMPETCETPA